jgi:mannose-6-phosphate isomerase-like protein (cupin superfamily)
MSAEQYMRMSYTKKNLKEDVQNSAPGFGIEGFEARFATDDLDLEQGGVGYERFDPGFRLPFGHTHKEQEEVYVVVGGSGRVKIEDEILDCAQWDVIRVAAGTFRNFEAGPDGLELVIFGSPHVSDRQAEAEMRPGWWSD